MRAEWRDAVAGRRMTPAAGAVCGAAIVAAVAWIYQRVVSAPFFNDDYQWLMGAPLFDPVNFLHLERYSHFYRPVIEIYFAAGYGLFACDPMPFHVASIVIHLLTTAALLAFAHALTGRAWFAWLAATLFAVQPAFVDAVAWVGAITDMLPALWYILALWAHLRYLQTGRRRFYVAALVAFLTCLLTHETAATLLVMMVLLEVTFRAEAPHPCRADWRGRLAAYLPFALLLVGFLAIAYVVNSRSYLISEGHYRLGWHAIPNVFRYVVWLYVGKQTLLSYLGIALVAGLVLFRGTPPARFYLLWILVTIAPASLFTWGNVGRYLYLPAAGFALLTAAFVTALAEALAARLSRRAATAVAVFVAVVISVRFAVFATKAAANFRERARPYDRYTAALLKSREVPPRPGEVLTATPEDVEGIPELYRDPAAQAAFCTQGLHVEIRPDAP